MTFDDALNECNQSSSPRSEHVSRRENDPSSLPRPPTCVGLGLPKQDQQQQKFEAIVPSGGGVACQAGFKPRPAFLRYCSDESDSARASVAGGSGFPQLLVRQVNWNFYTDCQEDQRSDLQNGSVSPPPLPLLPQTEEALKLLREIDSNIAAVEGATENGFGALVLDNGNCGDGADQTDNMSYYLRDGARSLFFNPPPQDSASRSETEPLQRPTVEPEGSGASTSSSLDKGRMFKRPVFGPSTSTLSGIGSSKPVASSLGAASSLYPSQPPRIIGSTSANFGTSGNKLFNEPDVTANSLKITYRPSPTSSTATTTPNSTAPGSGTHQPVETQMPANRNSGCSALGGNAIPNSSANSNVVHSSTSAGNKVHRGGNVVNNYGGDSEGGRNATRVTAVPQTGAVTPGSDTTGVQLTLYGWRKKCLYSVILILMIMIIINLALTLWILKVMEFSSDGMGQLKIVSGGIQLTGQAMVLDILRASSIRSKHGQPISIESSRNFSVNTRDFEGYLENQLFLGHDRLEVLANHFRVSDTHGTSLFAVDRDEVTIGASSLRVEGEGGVIFKDSIQTPLVRAEAGKDLKLESPTRSLEVRATQEIFMQSRAGSIDANCLNDLKLHSVAGSVRLDASSILMPNLRTVQAPPPSSESSRDHSSSSSPSSSSSHSKIYQLCACTNGKLFLAPAHSTCTADDSAICR